MPTTRVMKRINDEFEIKDVGSTLLGELGKGLYKPETVLREYVQNAIDAHRMWEHNTGLSPDGPVQIEFRGNGISILDYGIGMDEAEVRNVKAVAVSPKQQIEAELGLTGHKGVGIWAGLSFFERLTLRTTKRGSDRGYQLTIEFKKIKEAIDYKTHIGIALNPNYSMWEYTEDLDSHYTDITLDTPVQSADWFMTPDSVKEAIVRFCPCKVNPNFVFHKEVEDWHEQEGFGLYDIVLMGEPVYRDYPSNVELFRTETLTVNDVPIAEAWYAVSKQRMLVPSAGQLVGLRIYQRDFAIGESNPYGGRTLPGFQELSVGTYPNWYVGEVHVVSPELRPNLARDDFEESEIRRKLIQKMRTWYDELDVQARLLSAKRTLHKTYKEHRQTVDGILSGGAPLKPLDATQADDLAKIYKRLNDDEETASKDRRGRQPKSAIDTTAKKDKELAKLRKKLISDVQWLLPPSAAGDELEISTARGEQDTKSADARTAPERAETLPVVETSEGTPEDAETDSSWTSATQSYEPGLGVTNDEDGEEVEDETSSGDVKVALSVVLSLLEEVLREILNDKTELQSEIVHKLEARVASVVAHG